MKISALSALVLLIFTTCSNPVGSKSTPISSISGTIENWHHGDEYILYISNRHGIETFGSTAIDASGYFELDDLSIPDEHLILNTVNPRFSKQADIIENTLVCSDSTAKKVETHLIIRKSSDSDILSFLRNKNFNYSYSLDDDSVKTGDVLVEYVYVDKDVSLKGRTEIKWINESFPRKGYSIRNYDLNFKKGWNIKSTYVLDQEVEYEDDSTNTVSEYQIISYIPKKTSWLYKMSFVQD